jgi:hypothetical protein
MKHILIITLLTAGLFFICLPATENENISLIPIPVHMNVSTGNFSLEPQTLLTYDSPQLEKLAAYAAALWKTYLGYELVAASGITGKTENSSACLNTIMSCKQIH